MTDGVMWVVAGALKGADGRWLMHQRPLDKHHGGLWEFPGGKVESIEIPVKALIRELSEELGIEISERDCDPVGFAESTADEHEKPIVILLYTISAWEGIPAALEGGKVGWFDPKQIDGLAKPPLDTALAAQLFKKEA